jgi:hypothetical protein
VTEEEEELGPLFLKVGVTGVSVYPKNQPRPTNVNNKFEKNCQIMGELNPALEEPKVTTPNCDTICYATPILRPKLDTTCLEFRHKFSKVINGS